MSTYQSTLPTSTDTAPCHPTDAMSEVLDQQTYALLATRNDNGSIHAVPLVYLYTSGQLLMATSSTTRKARNITARPDVTVTVEDRDNLRWVSAEGRAELIRGERAHEMNQALYRLWMTDDGVDVIGRLLAEDDDDNRRHTAAMADLGHRVRLLRAAARRRHPARRARTVVPLMISGCLAGDHRIVIARRSETTPTRNRPARSRRGAGR